MTAPPRCYDCTYNGLGRPCAPGGALDAAALAAHYLREFCAEADPDSATDDQHWSFGCVEDLTRNHPDLAWDFVLEALRQMTTVQESLTFAAGPLEDLIARNGPAVIDRVEAQARKSQRFRMVLCGVWPQGKGDTPEWKRVLAAQATGPAFPDSGLPPT